MIEEEIDIFIIGSSANKIDPSKQKMIGSEIIRTTTTNDEMIANHSKSTLKNDKLIQANTQKNSRKNVPKQKKKFSTTITLHKSNA